MEISLNLVQKMAKDGLSINQSARLMKLNSDIYLRRFLKDHKELEEQFKQNGLKRKTKK